MRVRALGKAGTVVVYARVYVFIPDCRPWLERGVIIDINDAPDRDFILKKNINPTHSAFLCVCVYVCTFIYYVKQFTSTI